MADYKKNYLEAIIFGCAGVTMEVLFPLWCIAGLGVERLRKELNTI